MEEVILVLLAAGDSRRFHGNKLLSVFRGKLMYRHLVGQIEQLSSNIFSKKIVITQYPEIMDDLENFGYEVVKNHESELGISHSIHLAIKAADSESAALCFAVCDQPYLKAKTVEALVRGWRGSNRGIGCLSYQGELGNPAIFSSRYHQELLELNGDVGGKRIIHRHPEDLFLCEVEDEKELVDVDVRTCLKKVKSQLF